MNNWQTSQGRNMRLEDDKLSIMNGWNEKDFRLNIAIF